MQKLREWIDQDRSWERLCALNKKIIYSIHAIEQLQ